MLRIHFDLQLFAESSAGAASAGAEGGAGTGAEGVSADQVAADRPGRKRRANPLKDVKYGIQSEEPAEAEEKAEDKGDARENGESFEDLIKGRYKQDFDARVKGILQDRFKKNSESEAKLQQLAPVLEMLGKKYNVDHNDLDALIKTVGDDDSLYEDEAVERGMSVESLKAIKQMERENEQLKAQQARSVQEQRIQQHLQKLGQQADALKQLYPGFDLNVELQNPEFMRLTSPNVGIDVRTAYEVIHRDEMRGAEMQFAAQKSAERMAASVRANRARPSENAMNSSMVNNTVKSDPRNLTPEDRAEIRRRVQRGEKIVF